MDMNSPHINLLPAGPPPRQRVKPTPYGWREHKHPYGHKYYTYQDGDAPTIQLVTYSGPGATDALNKARKEILACLKKHDGVLPPKSHLVVILYSTDGPPTEYEGGYYIVDLQQKAIFWYVYITRLSVLLLGLVLT